MYKNKLVTILGLGRYQHGSGLAAVKFFMREGADMIITDLKTEDDLSEQVDRVKAYVDEIGYDQGRISWVMGEHREQDVTDVDLVVPNPGVPIASKYIKLAMEAGVPIETEMSIFFDRCPAPIIGVTGTRGKSTATALIAHLLKAYDKPVWMGGNIAQDSPLDFLDRIKPADRVVLEISNFMLEYLDIKKISPPVAVLLNVLPDHLDRHDSMEEYAAIKSVIAKYQKADNVLIVNSGNDLTKAIGDKSKAKVVWFDQLDTDLTAEDAGLSGAHNDLNVKAAVACVKELEDDDSLLKDRLSSFSSLTGRLQVVAEIDGVTYINDTTSTTPVATIAALDALSDRPIVLIAGGSDKGLDFSELASLMFTAMQSVQSVKSVIWLPGKGTDRLKELINMVSIDQVDVNNMKDAVEQARQKAESGDIILLSPACASFGLFKNEFDRGDQFNEAVNEINQKNTQS